MTWLSIIGTALWYLSLPFVILLRWLLVAIGPVLHLGGYIFSCMTAPLRFLAKFETLYIYLGVAAIVGLITGSILHISSAILASVFNLNPTHDDRKRLAVSMHSPQSRKTTLEKTWQSSLPKEKRHRESSLPDDSLEKQYAEWLEKTRGKDIDQGLFGQTILEEEDDSENGF